MHVLFTRRAAPFGAAFAFGIFLLTGCGGGGSGSGSSPNPPQTGLAQAQSSLNALVRSSGGQPVTEAGLSQVARQFAQVYQASPDNKDAALGYAISEAALAGTQFADAVQPGAVRPSARGSRAVPQTARLGEFSQLLTLWRIPGLIASGKAALPNASDFLPHIISQTTRQPHAAPDQTFQALDTALGNVEQALNTVAADPNYTYAIADYTKPSNPNATLKIGQAEIQVLQALVAAMRGIANVELAYTFDGGSFDTSAPATTSFQSEIAGSQPLMPSEYLPAGFGVLNPNGTANLQTTQTELGSAATDAVAAINTVETRTNSGYLLDPGTIITTDQLDAIKSQIGAYASYLTTSEVITMHGVQTHLNLSVLFSNPPADLKALAPTLTVANNGDGTATLSFGSNAYSDTTLGGLFPDGLPLNSPPRTETQILLPPQTDGQGHPIPGTATTVGDVEAYALTGNPFFGYFY